MKSTIAGSIPYGYNEYGPALPLQPYLVCYWSYLAELSTVPQNRKPIIPDGCIDVIFNLDPLVPGKSFVVGAMTQPITSNRSNLMGVRFKPGMAHPFFNTPMQALTDKIVDFDEFFGRDANMLSDTLTNANSINGRIAILNRAFSRRLSTLIPVDAAIGRALQLICHTLGPWSVGKISCEIGWSRQHLTRKCLRYTGLTPKFLSQTIRINTLIKHYQNKNPQNWSAFALESGFYDQAHMINTFKKITGCTPLEFLK